jgi:hypothetical protein
VDWGTVPAWVGAIGTVAAFAVTFALLLHEIRLRRDEASDQEKRQARLAWVDARGMQISPSPDSRAVITKPVIHNDSDETIRDPFVKVYDEHGQLLGDTQPGPLVISPGSEAVCHLMVTLALERDLGDGKTSAELFFTDADGRRWKKGPDQTLSRQLEG